MTFKILLDTNILIDYMIPDRPEHDSAKQLFDLIRVNKAAGYVCAGSLKDAYYICRKFVDNDRSRRFIRLFALVLEVLPLGLSECLHSLDSDETDFEDGLIRAVAELHSMDFIITRDKGAFESSPVRCLTAKRFVVLFG